ncbi:MAG: asparagine synthase-related protein [Polyangiaceae bacterium]
MLNGIPPVRRATFGDAPVYFPRDRGAGAGPPRWSRSLRDFDASVRRGIDTRTVLAALVGLPTPGDRTWYAGVARLRAGETLDASGQVRAGGPNVFGREGIEDRFIGTPEDAARALRARLEERLRRACAGRRVAVLVSGGLDSSAVAAVARGLEREGSVAGVIGVALDVASRGDDRPYLEALSRALDLTVHRLSPEDAAAHLHEGWVLDGSPCTWPTAPWDLALALRAKALGADVIVTGVGSDDVLDGPLSYFQALARSGHPIRAFADARRLQGPWGSGTFRSWVGLFARPWTRELVPRALRIARARARRRTARPWITRGVWRDVGADEPLRELFPLEATDARRIESFAIDAAFDARGESRSQLEGTVGLPVVDAFLDEDLGRLLASLPPAHFFVGDRVRGLLRLAMPDDVPEVVRHRLSKSSFESAVDRVVTHAARHFMERDPRRVPFLASRGWVDERIFAAEVERAFVAARKGTGTDWLALWPAFALEAFLERESVRSVPSIEAAS